MKVCIQIDSSFDDFLNKVGQMNNSSCGKICRLIVEHQLTFYLSRHTIPMFYPGVYADFKKIDEPGMDFSNFDHPETQIVYGHSGFLIPEGFLLKDYLDLCHVSSYDDLNDEQKKEYDLYIMGEGKYSCRKSMRK